MFHRTDVDTLNQARKKGRASIKKQMEDGKWKGWSGQGEHIRSYPEQYIEQHISKAGIRYNFQKQAGRYKIDFYLPDSNIALEVDGKQHDYPKQRESDCRKDIYLASQGMKVVRIKWASIKTNTGRQRVHEQIEALLRIVR